MATEKKIVTLEKLGYFKEKTETLMDTKDAAILANSKAYADSLADNYDPAGTATTKVQELANGAVKANTDAITKLNGTDTVEGSVAKQIKDATTTLKEEISASAYDDTAIKSRISANETAIATLNGTGVGSVDKKVSDAVAALVADAPEAYDTLKEISDWISSHSSDASAMNSQINSNKTDLTELKTLIGQLPEGTTSTTIVTYIAEAIGESQTDLTSAIATAKSEAISTASTDATTKANQALADAKTYADGLAGNYATAAQGAKADTALQKADVVQGTANGTISVKGSDVAVKGLGSAAYTASSAYATAAQGAKADSSVQEIISGTTNGTIKVDGTDVSVKGLGSAAYVATSAFDAAGSANTVQTALDTYKTSNDAAVKANADDIDALETKVATLESTTYTEVTEAEIDAIFATA